MHTKTPDEEQSAQKAALQLGQRALAQLALEAKAAQIQARQAELELMMEQAYQGNVSPLQAWLRIHGQTVASSNEHSASTGLNNARLDVLPPNEPNAQDNQIQGWHELLPFARQRLNDLTSGINPKSHPMHQASTTTRSSRFADADVRADLPHAADSPIANQTFVPNTATDLPQSEQAGQELPSPKNAHAIQTDDCLALVDFQQAEPLEVAVTGLERDEAPELDKALGQIISDLGLDSDQPVNTKPLTQKGRWRGAIASVVFHLVLIVLLAVVTIESPIKNGLLALVSGGNEESTEIESFEITNEQPVVEPSASTEMSEPTSQTNLSEVLPGLSDSVTQSFSESLSSPNPVETKSSLMAAKAGPAKNVMSFYGAESSGNSFCFVLDGSGSMRGGPWEAARQELLKSIGSLKPTQRFYIIFFNKDVLAITEPGSSSPASGPLLATPENLAHAKRWLDTLQITTGEPPMKALEVALELECDCIYFLADGEMSDGIAKRLLDMLRKKNRTMDILDGEVVMIPIHTIAYYSDKGLEIMRKIALENRGQFAYVPKPKSTRSGK